MKNYLVLIFFLISHYSNAQWIQTGNAFFGTIRGMYFAGTDTGYAVGENGMIAKSTDGGLTWSIQNSGVSVLLRSVFFLDANNGFACGASGLFLKTSNGGSTWSLIYSNSGQYFRAVDFPNSQIGFLAGRSGTILKTINGGSGWTTHGLGIQNSDVIQLQMVDVNTGYATCSAADYTNGYIFKTIDGGSTWTQVYSNSSVGLLALAVIDADTIYAGGNQEKIFKSTDGGSNWNLIYTGSNTASQFRAAAVRSSSSIIMTSAANDLVSTDDFGNSWNSESVGDNGLYSIYFSDSSLGYTADGDGNIYKKNYECQLPEAPDTLSGDTVVCFGSQAVYTVSPVPNADAYLWSIPPGATLISGQGDTTAVIQFNDSVGGIVTVTSVSSTCGAGGSVSLGVEVGSLLQAGTISGETSVCSNQQQVYSIFSVPGADTYEWTAPDDATILSGQGDTSVLIQFGVMSGAVTVTPSGGECSTGGAASTNVFVSQLPQAGLILGPSTVCSDDTVEFTTQLAQFADSYQWSVPNDAVVISGQGTTDVKIHFGNTSGYLSVTVSNNACGQGSTSTDSITISPSAVTPVEIFGDTVFCSGDTALFYINGTANSDSYQWTVSNSFTILSGQGDTAIYVLMGSGAGLIKVYAENSCGTSNQIQHGVDSHPSPAPVITFTNDTLFSSSPYGNQWYYNGTMIPGATSKFYVPNYAGSYYVVVTSNYGCTAASNSIEVYPLGLNSAGSFFIDIYPNPSGGKTIIDFHSVESGIITIRDAEGRIVFTEKNFSGTEFGFDASVFAKGIYLVQICNDQNQLLGMKKLVVQ